MTLDEALSIKSGDLLIWNDPYGNAWPHLVLEELLMPKRKQSVAGYRTINLNAQCEDEVLCTDLESPTWAHVQCFGRKNKIV